MNYSQFI